MKRRNHNTESKDNLSDRQFELIKLEIGLLQQRIAEQENLQYRLRQFSMTLWIVTLGVASGITGRGDPHLLLLTISILIPVLFMYLEARYASYAQKLRSRRNFIIIYFNLNFKNSDVEDPNTSKGLMNDLTLNKVPILDLTGDLTLKNDPQTVYRKNILVKLTRTIRLLFYGFQMLGSMILLSNLLADKYDCIAYYLLLLIVPFLIILLHVLRISKKNKIIKNLPKDYKKSIDEHADALF